MNKPTSILQEFVIQTYLWVLAGRLCGIRGLLEQRFHNVPETSNLADFPQRRRKRNRECVRLVMLFVACINFYTFNICRLLICEPNTSDIPTFWLWFVFAALSNVNKSILCVTDNFLFASACAIFLLGKFLGKPNNFSNQPTCRMSVKCCDGTLQKCCVY